MLVTSATMAQLLTKTQTKSVKPVITAQLELPSPSDAQKLCITLVLVLLIHHTVNLAKLVTIAWITTVCLVCALRAISVRKRLRSPSHASKALSTLTRSKLIRMTASCAQPELLATRRVLMIGLDTYVQLVTTAHVLA